MLTDAKVRNAKHSDRPTKLSDAGGLHLLIQPNGSKLWRASYRYAGKQKTLAIGVYPIVGLKDAREIRDEAKRQLAKGIDPSAQRRLDKQVAANGNSFKAVAEEVLAKLEKEGRADVTLTKKRWLGRTALRADKLVRIGSDPNNVPAEIAPICWYRCWYRRT